MHGGVIHRAPGCGWRLDHILAGEDHHALAGLRAFAMASVVADAAAIAPRPEESAKRKPGGAAFPVAGRGGRTLCLRPAAVAVEDHAKVPRTSLGRDVRGEQSLVHSINHIRKAHE